MHVHKCRKNIIEIAYRPNFAMTGKVSLDRVDDLGHDHN
jgi:hypothetical protein